MGLSIHGKKSKKGYSCGYSGFHLVRHLALMSCGLSEKMQGESSFLFMMSHYINRDKIPTRDEIMNFVWATQLAGHHYPNLMFHSDCEGTYTKRGKVFAKEGLLSGNSVGLLKELELLKEHISKEDKKNHERACHVFDMLYELAKDEVENGAGYLEFG